MDTKCASFMIVSAVTLLAVAGCQNTVTTGDGSGGEGPSISAGSEIATGGSQTQGDVGAGGVTGTGGAPVVGSSTATTGSGSAGPSNCALEDLVVTPSDNSPTDGCDATYVCDNGVVVIVECDGENDGTYTSLCSCFIGEAWADGGLVDGEGEAACPAGFANCMQ